MLGENWMGGGVQILRGGGFTIFLDDDILVGGVEFFFEAGVGVGVGVGDMVNFWILPGDDCGENRYSWRFKVFQKVWR